MLPPETVEKLRLVHTKGILIHGPPGTGKTLTARQIGHILSSRKPKHINGPEIFSSLVCQSEEEIRKIFEPR
jgi:vesicle-fusing ATPase